MTQEELSSKTKISQSNISSFESGKRKMTSDNLDRIFEVLGIKYYKDSNEHNWNFAKECAKILKDKGVNSIMKMSQEEVSTLTGKEEIMRMQVYNDKIFNEYITGSKADDSYNYMKTLIEFHLAMLK